MESWKERKIKIYEKCIEDYKKKIKKLKEGRQMVKIKQKTSVVGGVLASFLSSYNLMRNANERLVECERCKVRGKGK